MYLPRHFEQHDAAAIAALLHDHPLAALCTTSGADGLAADHVPFEYDAAAGEFGTLRGHVARANPLWRHAAGQPVLAIFQGPQAYVSPTWYAAKAATHRVVPTWNYAVVHAHGVLRAIEDADWLLALVTRLTARHEQGRQPPWAVGDAPADFVAQLLGAIVGIEIPLTRLVAKWKSSQNRSAQDRRGVAAGLGVAAATALVQDPHQEPP